MDENDMNIQKYLIWFDEVEKISLFGDDEDWILSDSDPENIMDQNEVSSTPPDNSGGYEYTSSTAALNPSIQSFQYTDGVQTYTSTETVVDSSLTSESNVVPSRKYESNYLAPKNFYGNSAYASTPISTPGHYGRDTCTEINVYSNNRDNVHEYTESVHETFIETKAEIFNEVCVEEAKVEIKTEDSQHVEEPQAFSQQGGVMEHASVTVKQEEEPQQGSKDTYDPNASGKVVITMTTTTANETSISSISNSNQSQVQNLEANSANETNNQSISNGNRPAEIEIQNVQMCIRSGCVNQAINNPEWEQEFCSNECVILHCKNVFTAWVKSNEVTAQ